MKPTDFPNTQVQVPLSPSSSLKFGSLHLGLGAYVDAQGVKCASYQLLNLDGYAIASCSISGDLIEETLAAHFVDISAFHNAVRVHFAETVPVVFKPSRIAA